MTTLQTRNDAIEHGDLAALICVDDPAVQNAVIEQLTHLGFSFHTAHFPEEVSMRLRARNYEIVVIGESFGGGDLSHHPVIEELNRLSLEQRRIAYAILVGPSMESRSEMQAFLYSVDLTLREDQLDNLKTIVGRGIVRKEEFYNAYNGVAQSLKGTGLA